MTVYLRDGILLDTSGHTQSNNVRYRVNGFEIYDGANWNTALFVDNFLSNFYLVGGHDGAKMNENTYYTQSTDSFATGTVYPVDTFLTSSFGVYDDGSFYMLTGNDSSGDVATFKSISAYDGSWTARTDYSEHIRYCSTCYGAGTCWQFGGYTTTYSSISKKYSLIYNTWSSLTSIAIAQQGWFSQFCTKKIWIAGDNTADSEYNEYMTCYDIDNDSHANKSARSSDYGNFVVVRLSNEIYLFSGSTGGSDNQKTNQSYSIENDSYTTKTSLPDPSRRQGAGGQLAGIGYCFGGQGSDDTDSYNPLTDSWTSHTNLTADRYLMDGAGI